MIPTGIYLKYWLITANTGNIMTMPVAGASKMSEQSQKHYTNKSTEHIYAFFFSSKRPKLRRGTSIMNQVASMPRFSTTGNAKVELTLELNEFRHEGRRKWVSIVGLSMNAAAERTLAPFALFYRPRRKLQIATVKTSLPSSGFATVEAVLCGVWRI